MSRARPYQTRLEQAIEAALAAGATCAMPVLATGGGKTIVVADVIRQRAVPTCAMAHRQELVGQISVALAREGIRHGILAPRAVIRSIVAAQMAELGRSYYDPGAPVKVAGVDTLVRMDPADAWFASVRLVVIDEGHHVLLENKWGKAFGMFPNAFGLFPTATPRRADGKGLGRKADGLVDVLIEGPNARELIEEGYLTDYRVWCPTVKDVQVDDAMISESTGDFNNFKLREAVHASKQLVGDVVAHYLRIAPGEPGITFAVDVEEATKIAAAFRAAGVPAEVVSAKTPDDLRRAILRRFKRREVLQLVNVDLFGEGFDVPHCSVVSMARHTNSFSLFAQQFGRVLRVMVDAQYAANWDRYTADERKAIISASIKPRGKVIDHVGNIERLGLPDRRQVWTLDRRDRKTRNAPADGIPLRICLAPTCAQPYERVYKACPYCGTPAPLPAGRGSIEAVDGDLTELDPAMLAALRGDVAKIDGPARIPTHLEGAAVRAVWNNHRDRQQAQTTLRHAIGTWAAVHDADESVNYRRFYFQFGVDVASAQALGTREAEALRSRIEARLALDGFVINEYKIPVPA